MNDKQTEDVGEMDVPDRGTDDEPLHSEATTLVHSAAETPRDKARRLAKLEHDIQTSLHEIHLRFREVGQWLAEIRDGRLYKEKGFAGFEEYCKQTFGFSRQHGYRQIDAAEVVDIVEELNPTIAITNEGQARALVSLRKDPDKLKAVVDKLAKSDEPLTYARIRAAVREVAPKRRPTERESDRQRKLRQRLPAGVEWLRWGTGTVATVRLDLGRYIDALTAHQPPQG